VVYLTTKVHIGTLPPPLGGISVYLYRLSKLRKEDQFIDTKNITYWKSSIFWFIKQIFNREKKIYICHSLNLRIKLMLYILSNSSIHDFSICFHSIRSFLEQYYSSNFFFKFLIKRILRKTKYIIVVNPDYKKYLRYLFKIDNRKIQVKHAFIPPPLEEENKIINTYDDELQSFLTEKNPIIMANAYALVFFKNQDLYGLDMCIELTQKLKREFPNLGFLFALANKNKNSSYFTEMKKKIDDLDIKNNFYFITGQKEIWPIFKKIDMFIRPTNTDGDSVSIREALHFNCPVIASDIVKRPKNSILFKNRELNDLYEKAIRVLKNINL